MSQTGLDVLLERLINEDEFRQEFEESREDVLSSFELSDEERSSVSELALPELVTAAKAYMRPCAPNLPI